MMEDRRMLLRLLDKYHFAYVYRILYNIRLHGSILSSEKNAPIYNAQLKLFTDRALKRWGGQFQAEYVETDGGWYSVKISPEKSI